MTQTLILLSVLLAQFDPATFGGGAHELSEHLAPLWRLNPLESYLVFWVAGLATQALPGLTPQSSPFYVWFFNFSHALVANVALIAKEHKKRIEGTGDGTGTGTDKE